MEIALQTPPSNNPFESTAAGLILAGLTVVHLATAAPKHAHGHVPIQPRLTAVMIAKAMPHKNKIATLKHVPLPAPIMLLENALVMILIGLIPAAIKGHIS